MNRPSGWLGRSCPRCDQRPDRGRFVRVADRNSNPPFLDVSRTLERRSAQPAGERARFEALYRHLYGDVLAYVLRRTSPHEAEDVVAECFLVAWRRFHELPEDSLPWLYSVARRVLANHRRAGRRRQALTSSLNQQPWRVDLARPSDPADRVADHAEVLAAFARLSERDREVLSLAAWEELSAPRAAKALNCTPATFTVRLHRARRRLAGALAAVRGGTETSGVAP